MKCLSRLTLGTILIFGLSSTFITPVSAQETPVKAELPVLVTSCGQSPGPTYIKVFMTRLGFDFEFSTLATAEDMVARKEAGNPFKSIIIVTGASLKGMGAAGISIEDELARTNKLIEEARKQGMTIIGAHIEGMDRRAQGAAPGDNSDELSIDAVCPLSDLLLIKQEGDEDGRFTAISTDEDIPMILFEKLTGLNDILKDIFGE